MEFPVLLVFDDNTLKIIKSEGELCPSVELSCCNTTEKDYFVNVNLQLGRRLCSNEDQVWELINSGRRYSDVTNNISLDRVKADLESALIRTDLEESEVKLAKTILERINSKAIL